MVRTSELLLAALFALLTGGVLLAGAVETVLWWRTRGGPAGAETPSRRWRRRSILGAAAGGVLCLAWGRFVEPGYPETTLHRIGSPALPAGAAPLRVVHLTDLHCDAEPLLEEELPALVAAAHPDLVVFTGDAANGPEGIPLFRRTLASLVSVAPVFAVTGNWDGDRPGSPPLFEGTGAVELDGTARVLEVRGTRIAVAGVGWDRAEAAGPALRALPRDAVTLLLCHSPDQAVEAEAVRAGMAEAPRVDLVLAGHTHGGQVALPLLGPVITLTRTGRPLARGLHRLGGTRLFVSRGIGMQGGIAPRVRFLARPEIAVIEFLPAGSAGLSEDGE